MKTKKRDIYINGLYLETARNQEEAERRVERYERYDRYEIETLKYKNPMPIYEIREPI